MDQVLTAVAVVAGAASAGGGFVVVQAVRGGRGIVTRLEPEGLLHPRNWRRRDVRELPPIPAPIPVPVPELARRAS